MPVCWVSSFFMEINQWKDVKSVYGLERLMKKQSYALLKDV